MINYFRFIIMQLIIPHSKVADNYAEKGLYYLHHVSFGPYKVYYCHSGDKVMRPSAQVVKQMTTYIANLCKEMHYVEPVEEKCRTAEEKCRTAEEKG